MRHLPPLFLFLFIPTLAFASAKDEKFVQERFEDKIKALGSLLYEREEAYELIEEALTENQAVEVAKQELETKCKPLLEEKAATCQEVEEGVFLKGDLVEWEEEKDMP